MKSRVLPAVCSLAIGCAFAHSTHAEDKPARDGDDRLLLIRWNDKLGYIDQTGKVVVSPKYDSFESHESDYRFNSDEIARRSYSEGLRPVQLGPKWGYIDAQDKLVIPATFDMAGPFADGRAQVLLGKKWGVINRQGTFVVDPLYYYIAPFEKGCAPVALGGERLEGGLPGSKWGLIDSAGKVILRPKFDMVYLLGEGVALANVGGTWKGAHGDVFVGGKWGVVDRQGKFLIEPSITLPTIPDMESPPAEPMEWERAISLFFAHGLAPVAIDGKWGYLNERGSIAIKPQFDWAGPFAVPPHPDTLWWPKLGNYGQASRVKPTKPTTYARAQYKGKFGFIDRTGAWTIKPLYDRVGYFSDGLAWGTQGARLVFINDKGVEAFAIEKADEAGSFWNGLVSVRVGQQWGYVDRKGLWVHKPQFDEVDSLTDSLQIVVKNEKRGLLNYAGKLVCPIVYDWIWEFRNSGLALVKNKPQTDVSECGIIDKNGRVVLTVVQGRDFSTVTKQGTSDQRVFPRLKDGHWGFVDSDGKYLIPPQFDSIKKLGEGMVAVHAHRHTGLVDVRSGEMVCPPLYDWISEFSEGYAAFESAPTGKGYLNRKGKIVVRPTPDGPGPFRNAIASVTRRGAGKQSDILWIDRNGKYLWEPTKK